MLIFPVISPYWPFLLKTKRYFNWHIPWISKKKMISKTRIFWPDILKAVAHSKGGRWPCRPCVLYVSDSRYWPLYCTYNDIRVHSTQYTVFVSFIESHSITISIYRVHNCRYIMHLVLCIRQAACWLPSEGTICIEQLRRCLRIWQADQTIHYRR